MAKKKVVLVTGVASYWGARVAAQLMAEHNLHVIGLDAEPPAREIKQLDFVQADIRNPLLVDLLKSESIHTVCHLTFVESARLAEAAFDVNVVGTIKVMSACAEIGVAKIVLRSSAAVYGAHPNNSAFLTEDAPLNGSRLYGYTRDLVEIEAFCNGFRRQAPQVMLTVLRFPSIIGPTCDTPMTRFLKELAAPVLWGFDPMMQVIHEDDVAGALAHAVQNDVPGVFNVAAEGSVPLSRLAALAGKLAIPALHPLVYWGAVLGGGRLAPIEPDYLRYPWVGDLTKLRSEFGFAPRYTAVEALREFEAQQRLRPYLADALERAALDDDQERLRDTIESRRRARAAQPTSITPSGEEKASDE
jgi:UDP-glucose 4-epimerase